ncbi:MAG: hypothetical protein AAFO17_17030, partial [Pseudomonadota bacterium]
WVVVAKETAAQNARTNRITSHLSRASYLADVVIHLTNENLLPRERRVEVGVHSAWFLALYPGHPDTQRIGNRSSPKRRPWGRFGARAAASPRFCANTDLCL